MHTDYKHDQQQSRERLRMVRVHEDAKPGDHLVYYDGSRQLVLPTGARLNEFRKPNKSERRRLKKARQLLRRL